MFPAVDGFTVRHTLRKCRDDVDRSMDVLLNLAFFEEQQQGDAEQQVLVPKGVDGFETSSAAGRRKGKRRKAAAASSSSSSAAAAQRQDHERHSSTDCCSAQLPSSGGASPAARRNKWSVAQQDVDFICARTSAVLKQEAVRSAYHANSASLSATIQSLALAHAPTDGDNTDNSSPGRAVALAELKQECPTVPSTTLAGLLRISRNSVSAAHELAAAMLSAPNATTPHPSEIIQIKAAPIVLDDGEPLRAAAAALTSPPTTTAAAAARKSRDFDTAYNAASSHFAASSDAFSKASSAYRRGKSDRLMGGAAAYYSAVGREHLARARREASAAADALVDCQSQPTALDLHGVSVQDAVRIASERVALWWHSLGEARHIHNNSSGSGSSGGGGGGAARRRLEFHIITGLGRHSHNGTARLGPAVGRALARDGWKVEVGSGVLTVTGVVRRP